MNGKVMPLVGISESDDAMFTNACSPNPTISPPAASTHKQIRLRQQPHHRAHHDRGEHQNDEAAEKQPELLARHGKHEIRARIRQIMLHLPLARPEPEHPAIAEGGKCRQRLIGGSVGRMQEQHHARMHMGDEQERADARRPATSTARDADPFHVQPVEIELREHHHA